MALGNTRLIDDQTRFPIQENEGARAIDMAQGSSSIARGTDNLQASLYGFANALGGLTGFDALASWGEEGMLRNLEEAALNPATIRTWDDVDSLSEFGTYFLESVAEQLPQLAVDAGMVVAGGVAGSGIAGVVARRGLMSKLQKAAFAKTLQRKMGTGAITEFTKRKAATAVAGRSASAIGAGVGVGLSNLAQNAGETQIGFNQRGIDAPGTALVAGVAKAALDSLAPLRLIGITQKTGVAAKDLPDLMMTIAKEIGITGGTESVTEGMQTMVDFIATKVEDPSFEMFTHENWLELREAMIKGGLVGATLGGGVTGLTETAAYRKHKQALVDQIAPNIQRELQTLTDINDIPDDEGTLPSPDAPPPSDGGGGGSPAVVAESQETIDAQARALADPANAKDTMIVTDGSPEPSKGLLPPEAVRIETPAGVVYTTQPRKRAAIARATPETLDSVLGTALYNRPEGKQGVDGVVIVASDKDGNPIAEVASSQATLERDAESLRGQVPPGGALLITTADDVLARRTSNAGYGDALAEVPALAPAAQQSPDLIGEDRDMNTQGPITEVPVLRRDLGLDLENPATQSPVEKLAAATGGKPMTLEQMQALVEERNRLLEETEAASDENNMRPDETFEEFYERRRFADYDTDVVDQELVEGADTVTTDKEGLVLSTNIPDRGELVSKKATYSPRKEEQFLQDALTNARITAGARIDLADSGKIPRAEQEIIRRTVFPAKINDQEVWFSAPQLTSAGIDLLNARGVATDLSDSQFEYQAFSTMLGEMIIAGYEIPPTFFRDNPKLIVRSTRNHRRQTGATTALPELVKAEALRLGEANSKPTTQQTRAEIRRLNERADMGDQQAYVQGERLQERLDNSIAFDPGDIEAVALGDEFATAPITNEASTQGPNDKNLRSVYEGDDRRDASGENLRQLNRGRAAAHGKSAAPAPTVISTPVSQERRDEHRRQHGATEPARVEGVGEGVTQTDVDYVRGLLDELGMSHIGMTVATPDMLGRLFKLNKLSAAQVLELQESFKNPSTRARFIPNGRSGVIVIRPSSRTDNEALQNRMLVLGHEVGHGVFNAHREKILNPATPREKALAARMRKAWQEDAAAQPVYQGEAGFKEWYADKISARARGKITARDTGGLINKFFATVVADLRKLFNSVKGKLPPRFHRNRKFENVIDAYREDNVFANARSIHGDGQIESYIIDEKWAGTPFVQSTNKRVRGVSEGLDQDDVDTVSTILNDFGLTDIEVVVATSDRLDDLVKVGALTEAIAKEIRAQIAQGNEGRHGFATLVNGYHTIVLPPKSTSNDADTRAIENKTREFIRAHETGHIIAQAAWIKARRHPELRAQMLAQYQREKGRNGYYNLHVTRNNVAEWFSDQIATQYVETGDTRTNAESTRSSNKSLLVALMQAVLDKIFAMLRRVAAAISPRATGAVNKAIRAATNKYDPSGIGFWSRTIHSTQFAAWSKAVLKDSGILADLEAAPYQYASFGMDIPEGRPGPNAEMYQGDFVFGATFTRAQLYQAIRNAVTRGRGFDIRNVPFLRGLFDVANQLEGMGLTDVARMIYQQTNSKNSKAYWTRVEAETDRFVGELQIIFARKERKGLREAVYMELARELPDAQLSRKALQVRNLIRKIHGYSTDVIPNIGEIENYFPRDYALNEISSRSEEFIETLKAHGFNERDATQVLTNLLEVRSVSDPAMFVGKHSHLHKHRQLSDNALVAELVEKGFLNADPEAALHNYIRKTVRRVELERLFGGYKPLKAWRDISRLRAPNRIAAARAQNQAILESYLSQYGYDVSSPATVATSVATAEREGHLRFAGTTPEWRDPTVVLEAMMANHARQKQWTQAQLDHAMNIVQHALDAHQPVDPDSMLFNVTGELRAFESLRTLLFSGVASIPETGAIFARNKGTLGAREFASSVADMVRNFSEFRSLAEAYGAVHRGLHDAMLTEMMVESNRGKHRYFRRLLGPMFQLNGNNALVLFSRVLAVHVGRQFIAENARVIRDSVPGSIESVRATRYLKELGITDPNEVLAWLARDGDKIPRGGVQALDPASPDFANEKLIRDAVNRFVNESVIRPNAAERPTWARHPLGGLVFHLKTFAYSYSKNIVGGLAREGINRSREGDQFYQMLPYYLAAVGLFIALGALGDELRNRIKTLGQYGSWDNAKGDPATAVNTWIDRSGLTAIPFIDAIPIPGGREWSVDNLAFAAGPTVSHAYDLFGDGTNVDRGDILRSIPILSQLPAARRGFY